MSQSLANTRTSSAPGSTPVSLKALQRIVTCIENNHLQPKSFIEGWLSSNDPEIVKSQRRWFMGVGLQSTGRLLNVIRDIILSTKPGQEFWDGWVLSQAIKVAKNQQPPSGSVPKGFYINKSKVTPLNFDHADIHNRDILLEELMPFLYSLIQSIFTHNLQTQVQAADLRKSRRKSKESKTSNTSSSIQPSGPSSNTQPAIDGHNDTLDSDDDSLDNFDVRPLEDSEVRGLGGMTLGEDNEYVQSWDGYVFRKSKDQAQNLKNRRQELKKKLVDVMGEDHWLAPFITLDNIDFQEHVHTPTVQKESTMCNGSWGYIHRPKIPEGIPMDHDSFTAEKLNAILNEAEQKPISITDITPTPTEIKDWNLTLKSQIAQTLVKYVAQPIDGKMIPYRYPPQVTPLPTEKPDIMMLKMMSASDNSTAGVGDLYNAVLNQTGLSRETRVMKLNVETVGKERVKMTPERMKEVIDQTFDQYFGPKAIQNAESENDEKLLRLLLRGWNVHQAAQRFIFDQCPTGQSNTLMLREFLHRLKGRSGLNDVYQSHKNTIDHITLRNFLRMAHHHNIAASSPGSTLRGGLPNDMYAQGLNKLRDFARHNQLGRFHWPKAGGSHAQEAAGDDISLDEDENRQCHNDSHGSDSD
ncbi:uncharacterized protein MELLADRAFT_62107 [Melampsora larici-populina 98AG31]|uniref:DUF6589 domain-containing protein n=1 Tax=Melampsora larici-populina (strain 98AG31 / pathotype 3-4-7) TaxID=747676 RepID=F4RHL1_MELLP|nr:uncharacterized protein MELLADRAFT_62107 [Melampsora larici-populina 98AG31]EGG08118.1 hypothetical protein MELLADRAFT_62107 [Melampsora larici-populina 98AG31]